MNDIVYSFNGKDITMNVCIQIKSVINLLQDKFGLSFEEAAMRFYKSETYKTLQNTDNALLSLIHICLQLSGTAAFGTPVRASSTTV